MGLAGIEHVQMREQVECAAAGFGDVVGGQMVDAASGAVGVPVAHIRCRTCAEDIEGTRDDRRRLRDRRPQ